MWAGTNSAGTAMPSICADWTSSDGAQVGTKGQSNVKTSAWTDNGTQPCNQLARFVCFQR